jgi:HlyD family secretion protein
MNKRLLVPAGLIAVAGIATFIVCGRKGGEDGSLKVSGNIEVVEAQAAFRIPGRIATRTVDEGDVVRAGQVIATLDETDLSQQVAMRQAEVDAAVAALQELENGSRKEDVGRAKAALDAAEAEAKRLTADDARQKTLFDKEVISAREYDVSKTALDVARSKAREAQQAYQLVKTGPRRETIAQAKARVDQATQVLELAKTQQGYTKLLSPLDGVVLSKNAEPGEVVAAGTPVVTVGDLRSVYLRAYVDESDLGRIKLGQKVWVTVDAYPGRRFEGKLSFISPESEFTPKMVQTEKERVKLVYRVKVDVPNPDMALKPGMPADGVVEAGG